MKNGVDCRTAPATQGLLNAKMVLQKMLFVTLFFTFYIGPRPNYRLQNDSLKTGYNAKWFHTL